MVNHHPAKFSGHRHWNSGDMVLVCYVILQNHMMKGLKEFTAQSSPFDACDRATSLMRVKNSKRHLFMTLTVWDIGTKKTKEE